MGIMKVIVDEGLMDEKFIEERSENFEEFKESFKDYDINTVETITGVDKQLI